MVCRSGRPSDPARAPTASRLPCDLAMNRASPSLDVQSLADRAAISDVVIRYATGVDRRDWPLYRSCFTDPVEIDFSSFSGQPARVMPAEEWVAQVTAGLSGFDSTQHISANHVHTLSGDTARCVSYMQAAHFLTEDGALRHWILYGYYTNSLVRGQDGWRIQRCALTVTAQEGDPGLFMRAGERYRRQSSV